MDVRSDRSGKPVQRVGRTRAAIGVVFVSLSMSAAGCTWVPLTPEATDIRVAPTKSAVADCEHVGDIRAQTRSRIGFVSRSPEKVAEELESLARNDAVELGANVILAQGSPTLEGAQRFRAYRCPEF